MRARMAGPSAPPKPTRRNESCHALQTFQTSPTQWDPGAANRGVGADLSFGMGRR